eukprot:GDKI01035098.1.p1 GENE.GDKI01035098.1~~GDKI01035098.1.p1  ORF type:complete len:274 (+),score=24.93 GDKI01035098.1:125-946(+)
MDQTPDQKVSPELRRVGSIYKAFLRRNGSLVIHPALQVYVSRIKGVTCALPASLYRMVLAQLRPSDLTTFSSTELRQLPDLKCVFSLSERPELSHSRLKWYQVLGQDIFIAEEKRKIPPANCQPGPPEKKRKYSEVGGDEGSGGGDHINVNQGVYRGFGGRGGGGGVGRDSSQLPVQFRKQNPQINSRGGLAQTLQTPLTNQQSQGGPGAEGTQLLRQTRPVGRSLHYTINPRTLLGLGQGALGRGALGGSCIHTLGGPPHTHTHIFYIHTTV